MSPPRPLTRVPAAPGSLGVDSLLRPTGVALAFADRALPPDLIEELYALMATGPGMTGASPARIVFATSAVAKTRLATGLDLAGQTAAFDAPACAIIAYDREFAEQMLAFAADDFDGRSCLDEPVRLQAAVLRTSLLQGAYLAVSARALGLEIAFLPGFDVAAVTAAFFPEPGLEVIFVAALGFPAD